MKTIDATTLKMAISPNARNVLGIPYLRQNGGLPGTDEVTAFDSASIAQRAQEGRFAKIVRGIRHLLVSMNLWVDMYRAQPIVIGDVENELDGLMPWTPRGINHTASDLLTSTFFHCPTAAEAR